MERETDAEREGRDVRGGDDIMLSVGLFCKTVASFQSGKWE